MIAGPAAAVSRFSDLIEHPPRAELAPSRKR
jgi:hypothetical protein